MTDLAQRTRLAQLKVMGEIQTYTVSLLVNCPNL